MSRRARGPRPPHHHHGCPKSEEEDCGHPHCAPDCLTCQEIDEAIEAVAWRRIVEPRRSKRLVIANLARWEAPSGRLEIANLRGRW